MPLTRSGFIPIPPGPRPGFDHADVYLDPAGASRLYVAHTGADRVDVIDCQAASYLRALPGHSGVAGVLIDTERDRLFTSDRAAAQVSVYRCSDETLLARIGVGQRPNGLAFDASRARLYSFNLGEPIGENCTASVADLSAGEVIATIPLPGRPRWAVYDPATDTVFANIREPAQVIALSAGSMTVTRIIDVPVAGPHGLWLDGERLYCAADGNALVVLHRDTGAVQAILDLPGVPDVLMYGPALSRLYVAIGDPGVIMVVDTARMEHAETVPTEAGAHTIGIDPASHTVYAFLPASDGVAVYQER
jgi:DNA-binding beta-propeller fold protein YncE